MSKKKDSGTERHIAKKGTIRKKDGNFNESKDKLSGNWVMSDHPVPKPQGSEGGSKKKR